jgi:hypothetical protein
VQESHKTSSQSNGELTFLFFLFFLPPIRVASKRAAVKKKKKKKKKKVSKTKNKADAKSIDKVRKLDFHNETKRKTSDMNQIRDSTCKLTSLRLVVSGNSEHTQQPSERMSGRREAKHR